MSNPKFQLLVHILACIILAAGCMVQPRALETPSPTSDIDLMVPTSMISTSTGTATPQPSKLQLTYSIGSSVYGIDVSCLDAPQPCFGEPTLLFGVGSGLLGTFFWSPDGQKVAYEFENEVFVSDWNGEGKVKISVSPGYDGWPIWTPDGQHIIYETKDEQYYLIFMMSNLTGSDQDVFLSQKDLDARGNLGAPGRFAWSRDGKRLVFAANPQSANDPTLYQIFTYDLETAEFKQITDADADSFTPSFSPDGEWIISTRDIMKHASTGSLLVKISTLTDYETIIYQTEKDSEEWFWFPQWSPIGDWISFVMGGDIYLIRPDGTQLMNVTQSPGKTENAATWRFVSTP